MQWKLFHRELKGHRDELCGYTIQTIEITDKKFIASGENNWQRTLIEGMPEDRISGTVLELNEHELKKTDEYEPANYKRKEVLLLSGRKAWVYIAE